MKFDYATLLTDYGTADERVGVCKSILLENQPSLCVVDLCHDLEPFDVRTASLMLVRASTYLNAGVVVVDVQSQTTANDPIAVEVGDGESVLVGPNNGVLAPVVASVGGATAAVRLSQPSTVFLGRDVLAPAAARLCRGEFLEDLGTPIDAAELTPALLPFSEAKDGVVSADVVSIDRHGNIGLNVTVDQLEDLGTQVEIRRDSDVVIATRVDQPNDLKPKQVGVFLDATGLVSLVGDKASAQLLSDFRVWDSIQLKPALPLRTD